MWPFSVGLPEVAFEDVREKYDYIIVGGGTAGCVLANRLSASPNKTVLLVERGPSGDTWASRVPLFSSDWASDGSNSQKRVSEYQRELGRDYLLVNGSALGGSTRINAMLYTRGLHREYDRWAESGVEGWAWKDVELFFKRSEKTLESNLEPAYHGEKGEWMTRSSSLFFSGYQEIAECCKKIGLPYINDINSPKSSPFGCAQLHFTRDENQYRHSTNRAFLPADLVSQRKNLHILTNTVVEKLLIQEGRTRPCASGIQIASRLGARKKTVSSGDEIILCAGPFGSPQLLMLSGIGPAKHLEEHRIRVHKDLPAVGENLQDHFGVFVEYKIPMGESLLSIEKQPWVFFIELFRWFIWGTGMLLAPVLQLAIFVFSSQLDDKGYPIPNKELNHKDVPDIEIMPMAYSSSDQPFDKSRGIFSFLCVLLHPKSRGNVRLSSSEPQAPLKIDPRYLANQQDLIPLRASVKLALRLGENMRARGYPVEDWKTQMPSGEDPDSLDQFIRGHNRTTYHYSSTCRMGSREDAPDGGAVVDTQLKVFGINGLRVADSSVFPEILGTHLQAPTVMVAEKCADAIVNPKQS